MLAVLIFLTIFISSLFVGTILAYPIYKIVSILADVNFRDVIILSTQLTGLAGSLLYLRYTTDFTFENLGYAFRGTAVKRDGFVSFIFGLMVLVFLGISFYLLGIYDLHSSRDFEFQAVPMLILGAMGTGLFVAIFEETVFRGALLQGLYKKLSAPLAIIITSLAYSWVHFIQFDVPPGSDNITLFTAPTNFISAYTDFLFDGKMDAFLSLFVLGILLGMIRVKQGNIINCIGLHAGLVAGIKIFRYLAEYQSTNSHSYLVSSHDYRLGFMATFWLFLGALLYYFFSYRKMNVRSEE